MKFKVGDKVIIKTSSKLLRCRYAGKEGEVFQIIPGLQYPYCVRASGVGSRRFCATELEVNV